MIRSLEQAKQELGPFESDLAEIPLAAIAEFLKDYRLLRHKLPLRAERNIIQPLMCAKARENFEDRPGWDIHERESDGLFLLGYRGHWTFRLKKLDEGGRSSSILTTDVQRFLHHIQPEPEPEIPGMEGPTSVILGYRDPWRGARLADCEPWLVCPNGGSKRPVWVWPLSAAGQVVEFPSEPEEPQSPVQRVVAREPEQDIDDGRNKDKGAKRTSE